MVPNSRSLTSEARANPMAGNPLVTKADVQRAVTDLVDAVVPFLSPGGARARLGSFGAAFSHQVGELEGYARPLWGIVPLVAGGGEFAHWDRWRAGLAHGTDPEHPEYWGTCGAIDQRMVEMAAIGFALAMTPEHLWDPLSGRERDNVVEWLRGIERGDPLENNWQFFRLLVQAGFERVGVPVDRDRQGRSVALIDSFALGSGWYVDGSNHHLDYYVPWALHTYGLVLAASGLGDRAAAARYAERARVFAPDYQHWFAPDGAAFPFGRSLTYRFAHSSFWGALAWADVDALDWSTVRGLVLRNLRWWSERPISDRDGVLSVGYGYDNRAMAEVYSSPGSPYWAMKAFMILAAADDHPCWTVPDAVPLPPATVTLPAPGMVLSRDEGQVVAFPAQSDHATGAGQAASNYCKFAYSSRFGFSGDLEPAFGTPATDSMLAVTDVASGTRHIRRATGYCEVDDGIAFARWSPMPGVEIDSACVGGAPWHLRVHHVVSDRELELVETGFAVPWEPEFFAATGELASGEGWARAESEGVASAAADLVGDDATPRAGSVVMLPPNANVLHAHTVAPALTRTVGPGRHRLVSAVGASEDPDAVVVDAAPPLPPHLFDRIEGFSARADEARRTS